MRNFLSAKRFGLVLISFTLFAGAIHATPVSALPGPNSTPDAQSLFASEVVTNPQSLGRVERDAVKAARSHLINQASGWGIDPTQYLPSSAIDGIAGTSIVRFTQSIGGVEVANSLLAITVDKNGSLLSFTKSISDYSGTPFPTIGEAEASELLRNKLAENLGISPNEISVSKNQLVIVDSALVNDVPAGKYLAWRALTSRANDVTSISMTYLSQEGSQVLSSLPFVRKVAADPFVCDLQIDSTTPGYTLPLGVVAGITPSTQQNRYLDISTGGPVLPLCGVNTSGRITDPENVAIKNIKQTSNYFLKVLGQDINEEKYLGNISQSANNDPDPRISAFIDVCAIYINEQGQRTWGCPFGNAFWVPWTSADCNSGACSGIFLGRDFDHADDVIAHELAHGVTFSLAFSSAMADDSETAALSEAISDIFGEAMDQLEVRPGEAADPAWTMGEDVKAGGFRNLRNPSVSSINAKWKPGNSHDNNGPVNRLAFLLANGGKVGNVAISAMGTNANSVTKNDLCDVARECLGTTRMSQLVFAATSNLTASATYFDFGRALNNACVVLVKAKASGFTANTCKSVQTALGALGFTNASIKLKKISAKSKTTKPLIVSASMIAVNGTAVTGQKLALQVLVNGKWVTKQSRVTDGSGKASFSVKLNSKRKYDFRVITYSYSGLYAIKSTTVATTVS